MRARENLLWFLLSRVFVSRWVFEGFMLLSLCCSLYYCALEILYCVLLFYYILNWMSSIIMFIVLIGEGLRLAILNTHLPEPASPVTLIKYWRFGNKCCCKLLCMICIHTYDQATQASVWLFIVAYGVFVAESSKVFVNLVAMFAKTCCGRSVVRQNDDGTNTKRKRLNLWYPTRLICRHIPVIFIKLTVHLQADYQKTFWCDFYNPRIFCGV